jgi:hypothetical protein
MKYIFTIPVLIMLFAVCENPITFVWEVEIVSDSGSYNFTDTVTLTLTNKSEKVIDIRMCNDETYFALQRRVAGVEWITVSVSDCPGDARFESIQIGQVLSSVLDLSVIDDEEQVTGTYRIEYIIYPEDDRRVQLPLSLRVSNTFTITDPNQGGNGI